MTKSILAKKIREACRLEGEFLLRSGQTSSFYFDKYRFEAMPDLLKNVAQQMQALIPKDTELLAGLDLGGIPLVTALSLETGIPCRFVRKERKEYGTKELCEGGDWQSKKLCLVEDVITTGGQVLKSTEGLRSGGAKVDTVICAIFRGESDKPIREAGLDMRALFTKEDLA